MNAGVIPLKQIVTQVDWLIEYVNKAFSSVALEDGLDIHAAQSMDEYGDPEENRLSLSAERKDWRRIDNNLLIPRFWAITFLDAKGFRFYTPAIMTTVLTHREPTGNLASWFLSGMSIDESGRLKGVKFDELFDNSQRAAIVRFLKHLVYNHRSGCSEAKERLDEIQSRTKPRNAG